MFRSSEFKNEITSNIYKFNSKELNYFIVNEKKKFSIWQEGNRQDLSIRFWVSYQPDSTGIVSNKNRYYLNLVRQYYNIIITNEITDLNFNKKFESYYIFTVSYFPVYVNFLNMENFENYYGIRIL